jgi:uncharacterized repeat protein (TIGR02543 family)
MTALSIALAQGQFTLVQSGVGNTGASSGGQYIVQDSVGEMASGVVSGGSYQVSGGVALGGGSSPDPTFTLAVTASGNGTITLNPPGGAYAVGTVVQITATPATGFTFTGWSGAVTGIANPITITMDGDKTVTATFTAASTGDMRVYLPMIRQ